MKLAQLPTEVVQHIYSVKGPVNVLACLPFNLDDDVTHEPVLCLKDRLRALAVCRAWNRCLILRLWPVETLRLDGSQAADRRIARWVASTQPAVRSLKFAGFGTPELLHTLLAVSPRTGLKELSLYHKGNLLQDTLILFPGLKRLTLFRDDPDDEPVNGNLWQPDPDQEQLDLSVLQPLSALQRLHCRQWQHVKLSDSAALPRLTCLSLASVRTFSLDAALPSLQQLKVDHTDSLQLTGARLQLPQVSRLGLYHICSGAINWSAVPQLAALTVVSWHDRQGLALETSSMRGLTSLTLDYWTAMLKVLQAAPPSLRRLEVVIPRDGVSQPPFHHVPQLTSLTCNSPAILPHLGPLQQLRHLEFSRHSAASLTPEHIQCVRGLSSLHRLCFGKAQHSTDDAAAIQILERLERNRTKPGIWVQRTFRALWQYLKGTRLMERQCQQMQWCADW